MDPEPHCTLQFARHLKGLVKLEGGTGLRPDRVLLPRCAQGLHAALDLFDTVRLIVRFSMLRNHTS